MTDVATRPSPSGSDEPTAALTPAAIAAAEIDATVPMDTVRGGGGDVQWAPAEPAPRTRRLWLWIGIPAAVLAAGIGTASALLIAPGTAIAGVPVGFMTAGAATDAIQRHLDETVVTVNGADLTGAELGASVDAGALATAAFSERPLWNVTQWFGEPAAAAITIDADVAAAALRAADPSLYVDPTPATISFDGTDFVVAPAVAGTGVDITALTADVQRAFDAGSAAVAAEPVPLEIASATTTDMAQATATSLNTMLDTAGFYVGDERTVPVERAVAADWLTVTTDADGAFTVDADPAKIQAAVDTLPELVNREPINGTVITNTEGRVLDTIVQGQDGRELGDTAGVADAYAEQLAAGNGVYTLPVTVIDEVPVTLARTIEVDLSAQRVYLKENGAVVDSWTVATGRPGGAETYTGNYTINAFVRSQTMYGVGRDSGNRYEVPNVEWVMYFNGDQAFHGVYWQDNHLRGVPGSNGCVGMSNSQAQKLYNFAAYGTEVSIYGTTPS